MQCDQQCRVLHVVENRNVYKILAIKLLERCNHRWETDIKTDFKEIQYQSVFIITILLCCLFSGFTGLLPFYTYWQNPC
jgi:hypothetical protein